LRSFIVAILLVSFQPTGAIILGRHSLFHVMYSRIRYIEGGITNVTHI
jgi:hypothetical protein